MVASTTMSQGPAKGRSRERDPQPTARFVRDAIPYLDQLFGRARHLTRTRMDAEDLLQETMLKAFANFDSFQEGSNLKAWLLRIMMNTWISGYRRSQRRPLEQLTDEFSDGQFAAQAQHTSTGPRSAEMEALERLPDSDFARALRKLPKLQRTAVFYADVMGFPHAEIARLMKSPPGTVMSRLHRGRNQLRTLLDDPAKERMTRLGSKH
jgi:RNA polymerase sigma-70 factor (ECF subfamily)